MSETIEAIVAEEFGPKGSYSCMTRDEFRSAMTRAAEGRWVKVEDALPERTVSLPELRLPGGQVMGPQKNSGRVLVITRGNAQPTIDYLIEGADGTFAWYLTGTSGIVTHWRELPTPPTD